MYFATLQAKYYARSNGDISYERKDSDKVYVHILDGYYGYDNTISLLNQILPFILYLASNTAIAIVGIYLIPKLLQQSVSFCQRDSNSMTTKELNAIYWATVLVCAKINTVCAVLFHLSIKEYMSYSTVILPLKVAIFLIEVISIWIIIKDFKVRDSVCCFTNRYVLRAIHTLAICHILWFLHRVGCGLLVAIFFVALAPGRTLAAISLIFFVVLCTILYVAFNIYYINQVRCCTKRSCKIACKLFILFVLYLCVVSILACLTIVFKILAKNGLTSTGLGSVVLSFVAPTIVFIITLRLKYYLKKYFMTPSKNITDL